MKKTIKDSEEFDFDVCQKKCKKAMFQFTSNLLTESNSIPTVVIYILLTIQFLQILWFSIHPTLTFQGHPLLLSQFRIFVSVLNVDKLLRDHNQLMTPISICAFSIVIIHIISIVMALVLRKEEDKQARKSTRTFVLKGCVYSITIFNTILTIPIMTISIAAFSCNQVSPYYKDSTSCFNTVHILQIILAIFNIFVIVLETQFYWFLFYTKNLFCKSFYSIPNGLPRLSKFALKIIPTIFFTLNMEKNFLDLFIYLIVGLFAIHVLFIRLNSIHNFNLNFFRVQFIFQSALLWFFVNNLINFLTFEGKISDASFINCLLGAAITSYCVLSVEQFISHKFFKEHLNLVLKKQDIQKWIYMYFELSTSQNKEKRKFFPQHYFNIAYDIMKKNQFEKNSKKQFQSFKNRETNIEKNEKMANLFSLDLIKYFLKDNKTIFLKTLRCRLLYLTNQQILSLHEISELENDKTTLYDDFMIYEFKMNQRIYRSSEKDDYNQGLIELEKFLQFTENMNDMEEQIEQCALNNRAYWEELCQQIPSTYKIQSLAVRSHRLVTNIQSNFHKIISQCPKNSNAIALYLQFLSQAGVGNKQSSRLRQKMATQIHQQISNDGDYSISFNSNEAMPLLNVSTNSQSLGIVLNCNSELKKCLGFERQEILGHNVNKIMPSIFQQIHDSFIKNYLEKIGEEDLPSMKYVYALKKNQLILKVKLSVKTFPHLQKGFQLIGVFKEYLEDRYTSDILVNINSMQVIGVTKSFSDLVNNRINFEETKKQPLTLYQVFPQIDTQTYREGMEIQTILRLSDCTDKLIECSNQQLSSQNFSEGGIVVIKVKSIKNYDNIVLGTFQIGQKSQNISLAKMPERQPIEQILIATSMKSLKSRVERNDKNNQQRKKTILSSQFNKFDMETQKKVNSFFKKYSYVNVIKKMTILIILGFFTQCTLDGIIHLQFYQQQQRNVQIFDEIKINHDISILQNQILLINQRMFMQAADGDLQKWKQYKDSILQKSQILKIKFIDAMRLATLRQNYKLIINQFEILNIAMPFISEQNSTRTFEITYTDAVMEATFMIQNIVSNSSIEDFQLPLTRKMEKFKDYIEMNFIGQISKTADKVNKKYGQLVHKEIEQLTNSEFDFIISKLVICCVSSLIVTVLGKKKILKMHNFTFEIYNSILKWDSFELKNKCHKFLTETFQRKQYLQNDKSKQSQFILHLPKTKLLALMQRETSERKKIRQQNKKRRISLASEMEQDQDTLSFKQVSKKDYVNLTTSQSFLKNSLIFLISVLLIFILEYGFYIDFTQKNQKLKINENNLRDFSLFQASFISCLNFGLRFDQFQHQYERQLAKFYELSGNVYQQLGDPKPTLRRVYTAVELLNSIIKGKIPTLKGDNERYRKYIQFVEENLLQSKNQIDKEKNEIISNLKNQFLPKLKYAKIWYYVTHSILFLLASFLIVIYIVEYLRVLTIWCECMIKMLPFWLLRKNKSALGLIFQEKVQQTEEIKYK